ncbi:ATP cone domain-containing protein [Ruminococcus sp. 5_1_39BFAA]|uniref:ATP cone domain-containing protein n=1 Tax=Ruminococcus sp. 5_1_39BFAA TaxID=457412 RepID=UPI0035656F74
MRIIKRNGASCDFDVSKIVDAVSKACIRRETKKVEKKIHEVELFSGVGWDDEDFDLNERIDILAEIISRILDADYQERFQDNIDLQLELERLENQREQLRILRRLKTARVSLMIRTAWMNRNHTAGRSNTGAVTDPMLLSVPTPPTSEAANRSLRCGGNMLAYI